MTTQQPPSHLPPEEETPAFSRKLNSSMPCSAPNPICHWILLVLFVSSNSQKKPGPALLATSAKSDVIFSQKDLRVPTAWLQIGQAATSTRTRSSKLSKPDLPAALAVSLLSNLEITRHSSHFKPHQHLRTTPTGLNGQRMLHCIKSLKIPRAL